jgi:hypothetical protein
MKKIKNDVKPLLESDKQTKPMSGEVDPKNPFTKISIAANKALVFSGIEKKK